MQAWPRASSHTHDKILTIYNIMKAVHSRAPLAVHLFDVVYDQGSLFLCVEFCGHGSLNHALANCRIGRHIRWLVTQVRTSRDAAAPAHTLTRQSVRPPRAKRAPGWRRPHPCPPWNMKASI